MIYILKKRIPQMAVITGLQVLDPNFLLRHQTSLLRYLIMVHNVFTLGMEVLLIV